MKCQRGLEYGFNGSVVRVCVIDIGVDVNHPDVAGKMWTANGSILEVGGKCAGNMTLTFHHVPVGHMSGAPGLRLKEWGSQNPLLFFITRFMCIYRCRCNLENLGYCLGLKIFYRIKLVQIKQIKLFRSRKRRGVLAFTPLLLLVGLLLFCSVFLFEGLWRWHNRMGRLFPRRH